MLSGRRILRGVPAASGDSDKLKRRAKTAQKSNAKTSRIDLTSGTEGAKLESPATQNLAAFDRSQWP